MYDNMNNRYVPSSSESIGGLLGMLIGNGIKNRQTSDAMQKSFDFTNLLSDYNNRNSRFDKARADAQRLTMNQGLYNTADEAGKAKLHAENQAIRSSLKGIGFNQFGGDDGHDVDIDMLNKYIDESKLGFKKQLANDQKNIFNPVKPKPQGLLQNFGNFLGIY